MATPLLNETDRYILPEVTKFYIVPTIADLSNPTRAELDAGIDVTFEVAASTGWEVRADRVPTPDAGRKFTGRISGRVNPGDAQISYYADRGTQDIRDVHQRGDKTHVVIMDGGDVQGQKGRAFAVEVSAVTPTTDVAGTEATRIMVDYSINDVAEEFVIPAP